MKWGNHQLLSSSIFFSRLKGCKPLIRLVKIVSVQQYSAKKCWFDISCWKFWFWKKLSYKPLCFSSSSSAASLGMNTIKDTRLLGFSSPDFPPICPEGCCRAQLPGHPHFGTSQPMTSLAGELWRHWGFWTPDISQHYQGLWGALASKMLPTGCLMASQSLQATSTSGWQLAKHLLLCHTGRGTKSCRLSRSLTCSLARNQDPYLHAIFPYLVLDLNKAL